MIACNNITLQKPLVYILNQLVCHVTFRQVAMYWKIHATILQCFMNLECKYLSFKLKLKGLVNDW